MGWGKKSPRSRLRAPALAGQSALGTNFPNSPTSCQPPPFLQRAPPGRARESRARPGRGLLQSPADASGAGRGERVPGARGVAAPRRRPGRSPPCVWAPPEWGVAEAWASRGPASVCFWPRCSFFSGRRRVSRKEGDRSRIQRAGSSELPKDGVESGMGGVRGGRECSKWLGCSVWTRVSDSGQFVGVTAGGRGDTCDRVLLVDALE